MLFVATAGLSIMLGGVRKVDTASLKCEGMGCVNEGVDSSDKKQCYSDGDTTYTPIECNYTDDTKTKLASGNSRLGIDTNIAQIVNILLYIVGALSVVLIIVGGIYYVISSGNPENVKKAKNTIMYAVVGIIVSILAYAIVNFVVVNLSKEE